MRGGREEGGGKEEGGREDGWPRLHGLAARLRPSASGHLSPAFPAPLSQRRG